MALKLFSKKKPEIDSTVKKGISLRDPVLASMFGDGDKEKLASPYTQIPVVYSAIRAKAMNISQVPFRLYKIGSENEITSGPIYNLFQSVNPNLSKTQLWEAVVTLLEITGEGAVIIDDQEVGGVPVALWPMHRKNMEPAKNGNAQTGWTVKVSGRTVFVPNDRVIFNKYYNPLDSSRGLSPLSALRVSLESEWGAIQYNQSFFEKGTTVGAVYTTDQHLDDDTFRRLKHELISQRQGSSTMHEALLLDGGLNISNIRPSNKDLEFLQLRKFTREDVAMVFKVPKTELSLYEDVNYATAQSEDVGFWKKTLIPLMRLIQEQFNTSFLNRLGYEGYFDVQAIDALNQEILEKAQAAEKFFNIGFSRNQINDRLNLGFNVDGDEDVKKPMTTGPVIPEPTKAIKGLEISGELPALKTPEEITKAMRDAKWKSLMDPILPIMGRASRAVKNYYFDVEQTILKKVNKAMADPVNKEIKQVDDLDLDFVEQSFNEQRLQRTLQPILRDSIVLGIGAGSLPEETILSMIASRGNKITGINDNAKQVVLNGLRSVLDQAIKEGWTEQERADAINASIKETMGQNKKNAKTIARTETHGAYEEGRYESIKETQPPKKMWLESRDDKVRHEHKIDGETVGFDEPFSNGLQYPLDPAGDAGNVINCRCTWAPVYE